MDYGNTLALTGGTGLVLYTSVGSAFLAIGVLLVALTATGIRFGFRRNKSAIGR